MKAPATDEAGDGDAPSKDGATAKTGLTETEVGGNIMSDRG